MKECLILVDDEWTKVKLSQKEIDNIKENIRESLEFEYVIKLDNEKELDVNEIDDIKVLKKILRPHILWTKEFVEAIKNKEVDIKGNNFMIGNSEIYYESEF